MPVVTATTITTTTTTTFADRRDISAAIVSVDRGPKRILSNIIDKGRDNIGYNVTNLII